MRRSGSALLLVALVALGGCRPTCKEACRALLECDEVTSPRVSLDECEDSCQREEALYESWEDTERLHAFHDELECIVDSTCGEVAAGACYDEDLYRF